MKEYRRIAAFNRKHGVDVQEIGPSEVKRLFPLARVDDIKSGMCVCLRYARVRACLFGHVC